MQKRFFTARRMRAYCQTFFATLVMLVMVFPLYWMIITSFKTTDEVLLTVPTFYPRRSRLTPMRRCCRTIPWCTIWSTRSS